MKGQFLMSSNELLTKSNIYADKSVLVLDWLLRIGIAKEKVSLREVAKDVGVSIGLVRRAFEELILKRFLQYCVQLGCTIRMFGS